MNKPIQYRVGECWICYDFVPFIYGHLGGHNCGASTVTIIEYF